MVQQAFATNQIILEPLETDSPNNITLRSNGRSHNLRKYYSYSRCNGSLWQTENKPKNSDWPHSKSDPQTAQSDLLQKHVSSHVQSIT